MHPFNIKHYIVIVSLLFTAATAKAQQNFEGKIIYKQAVSENEQSITEAYFGKQKIRIDQKEFKDSTKLKETIFIDLEKGFVYHFNYVEHSCWTNHIEKESGKQNDSLKLILGKSKNILGHSCTGYYLASNYRENNFEEKSNWIYWYADSLNFHFDKRYALSDVIPMFGNGTSIALASESNISYAGIKIVLKTTAISIEQLNLPDSIFSIPLNCLSVATDSSVKVDDSLLLITQEVANIMLEKVKQKLAEQTKPVKKSPAKKSPAKNTHKQPTKALLTKPKESVTYKKMP